MDTQLLENAEVNAKLTVLQTQAQFSVKPCSMIAGVTTTTTTTTKDLLQASSTV
jgi:hypothetical protein